MSDPLHWMIENGSYAVFFAVLIIAGLGVPIPEDIVLIAAGVLSSTGVVSLWMASLVCFVGVLTGDLILFQMARRIGPAILSRKPLVWFLTPERRVKIEELFDKRGGWVVFGARHLAGLRAPIFATAAIHGMSVWRFLAWDTLGLCVSAPIVIGVGYYFSESIDHVFGNFKRIERIVVVVAILLALVVFVVFKIWRARRNASSQ